MSVVAALVLFIAGLAILFVVALGIDGQLSRRDGAALLGAYGASVLWIWRQSRKGFDIRATGEVGHTLQKGQRLRRWHAAALLGASLVGVVAGSEMIVAASRPIVSWLNLSETVFVRPGEKYILFLREDDRPNLPIQAQTTTRYIVTGVWAGLFLFENNRMQVRARSRDFLRAQYEGLTLEQIDTELLNLGCGL